MLSHGTRYSGLHLGMSGTLRPHGVKFQEENFQGKKEPNPIYVSRFYEQHVGKNVFLLEGRNYGMALMQSQNHQKISNNLKSVSKTLEHK